MPALRPRSSDLCPTTSPQIVRVYARVAKRTSPLTRACPVLMWPSPAYHSGDAIWCWPRGDCDDLPPVGGQAVFAPAKRDVVAVESFAFGGEFGRGDGQAAETDVPRPASRVHAGRLSSGGTRA